MAYCGRDYKLFATLFYAFSQQFRAINERLGLQWHERYKLNYLPQALSWWMTDQPTGTTEWQRLTTRGDSNSDRSSSEARTRRRGSTKTRDAKRMTLRTQWVTCLLSFDHSRDLYEGESHRTPSTFHSVVGLYRCISLKLFWRHTEVLTGPMYIWDFFIYMYIH